MLFIALGYNAMAQVTCQFNVSAVNGCSPLVIDFTDQSTGGVTTHYWDFDGVGTSTIQNPSATFTQPGIYNVKHVVSNGSSIDSCVRQVRVFEPPVVNFVSSNNQGCVSPCYTVNFTNQTVPGAAPILEYVWDYGDGSLAESVPPTAPNSAHCFNDTGLFTITLIARDQNGCQANRAVPNFVRIGSRPTISVTANPVLSCTSPLVVNFNATASSNNGGTIGGYTWFFGNGGTSAVEDPTQVYQTGIYTATVTATDPLGCQNSATQLIEVTPVQAGFTASNLVVCRGIPVTFTDTSNYANSWQWTFGDNGTSTQKNPTHTYNQNGSYTVSLTANYKGCTNTATKTAYITVVDPISVAFTADDTTACTAPHTVNFTSTIGAGATSILWNFGNNQTSTQPNPTATYNANGNYDVTLSVTGSSGCTNTVSYNDYIDVGQINAAFTLDSQSGCAPLTVTFDNNSTSLYPITTYAWDFGNGATSSQQAPTYVYTVNGQYTPSLTITNSAGCTDTYVYSGQVNVGGPGNPAFTATPLTQCVNQPIAFTDQTTGVNPAATYFWEFGDGGTSTDQNPTYEYGDIGQYSVTLTIVYNGCSTQLIKNNYITIVVPKAEFGFLFDCLNPTTVAFSDSSQGAQTWLWEFGDGSTSTLQNPTHTYASQSSYAVKLTVTNTTTGCVDSITKLLPIGTPNADFTADTTSGCATLRVRFTDASTFASSWLWQFGDGSTSTARNPTKNYGVGGVYTVTLIINPGQPCSDTIVKTNYITAYGIIAADYIPNGYDRCSPDAIFFQDTSSSYLSTINGWVWSFGDGDSSTLQNPSHTFTVPTSTGIRTVVFTVFDNQGCSETRTRNLIFVNPMPDFISDTVACPGETVSFTNLTDETDVNVSYRWDFGDGGTSTLDSPTHAYATAGNYNVKLVATIQGCSDSITIINAVQVDTPQIDFFPSATFMPCPPFPVQFTNFGSRPDLVYQWYFGDGDTSTFNNPLHVYDRPGKYTVRLIGVSPSGCTDTITYVDLIFAGGPTGVFSASTDSGCAPLTVQITAVVDGTTTGYTLTTDGIFYPDSLNVTHTYERPGIEIPTYQLIDSLGCQFSYEVDTIVIGGIPYPNLPTDTVVCRGNYIQFNLPDGDIFEWSSDQTPTYLSCNTCRNPLVTAPDTITYYVTATSNLGCSASDTILVNVDALPQIFPGIAFRICPSDTLQLSAGPNVQAATWSPNMFIDDTNSVNPKVFPPDTMVYRVTGSNSTGCSISRIVRIEVIQKVEAELTFTDSLLCEGGEVQLELNVLQASYNDTDFVWSPPSYLSSPLIEDPLFNAPKGVYNYMVIVSSSTCIPDTGYVNIEVAPKPSVEAGDDQTVAVGTQVQLWAASPNPVNYSWQATVDSFSCTDCRRPFITVTQNQTVYATAVNEFGCSAFDSVVLKVVSCDPNSVFVPNAFTPNNDDLNDRLFVRGIGLKSLSYFRIFDRWGQMVFETNSLTEGWDGTINGRQCEMATFVYMMKGVCSSGQEMEKSGNVTLVR